MIAINKHSAKPKNWCFKMPNAPYLKPLWRLPVGENLANKGKTIKLINKIIVNPMEINFLLAAFFIKSIILRF